jgi:hypothetical protein
VLPKFTVIFVDEVVSEVPGDVVTPSDICEPDIPVQVYVVADATGAIEYGTPNWLAQTEVAPVIVVGVTGDPFAVKLRTGPLPQELFAVTLTMPDVNTGNEMLAEVPDGVTTAPATLVDHV